MSILVGAGMDGGGVSVVNSILPNGIYLKGRTTTGVVTNLIGVSTIDSIVIAPTGGNIRIGSDGIVAAPTASLITPTITVLGQGSTNPRITFSNLPNTASTGLVGTAGDIIVGSLAGDLFFSSGVTYRWGSALNATLATLDATTGVLALSGGTGPAVAIGTNPAASGAIRLANNSFILGRNAANSDDRSLIGVDGSNRIQIGSGGGSGPDGLAFESKTISAIVFNDTGNDVDFRVEGDTLTHMIFVDGSAATENLAFLTSSQPNWQTMDGGVFIGNGTTAPTGNPTGGGFLYVVAGALTWRGSGGTVTTMGPA